jgi:hypothetical protein
VICHHRPRTLVQRYRRDIEAFTKTKSERLWRPHRCWGDGRVTQTGRVLHAARIQQISVSRLFGAVSLACSPCRAFLSVRRGIPSAGFRRPAAFLARPDWDRPVGYSAALSRDRAATPRYEPDPLLIRSADTFVGMAATPRESRLRACTPPMNGSKEGLQ